MTHNDGSTDDYHGRPMLILAGEQAAPNLLPARHFASTPVILVHTDFSKSVRTAENLARRLAGPSIFVPVDAHDPQRAFDCIRDALCDHPTALVNVTGGTKPMSFAALAAAAAGNHPAIYVRTQGAQTHVDVYRFDAAGHPAVDAVLQIDNTIEIDDYLGVYFGDDYQCTGFSKGTDAGTAFEQALYAALAPYVDEVKIGWKHQSGAVDVDFVVRCNNQVGIIEAKTGGKATRAEGIKQLAVAGGQRFFGTFTRRFLIVDQDWNSARVSNNRELAEALGIIVIALPEFAATRRIDDDAATRLIQTLHNALGVPNRTT